MSWIRIDDGFADHPKVAAAGPLAALIQVRALCYAARHLTDGFIPSEAVPSLLMGFQGLGLFTWQGELGGGGMDAESVDWPAHMVKHTLWERARGGFRIHDYLEFQPAREDILLARKRASEAAAAGGKARAKKAERRNGRYLPTSAAPADAAGVPLRRLTSGKPAPIPSHPLTTKPSETTREEMLTPRARARVGNPGLCVDSGKPSAESPAPLGEAVRAELERLSRRRAARRGEPGESAAARRGSTRPAAP